MNIEQLAQMVAQRDSDIAGLQRHLEKVQRSYSSALRDWMQYTAEEMRYKLGLMTDEAFIAAATAAEIPADFAAELFVHSFAAQVFTTEVNNIRRELELTEQRLAELAWCSALAERFGKHFEHLYKQWHAINRNTRLSVTHQPGIWIEYPLQPDHQWIPGKPIDPYVPFVKYGRVQFEQWRLTDDVITIAFAPDINTCFVKE